MAEDVTPQAAAPDPYAVDAVDSDGSTDPADSTDRAQGAPRPGLGRRSFLQLGLVGAGAAAAGLRPLAAAPRPEPSPQGQDPKRAEAGPLAATGATAGPVAAVTAASPENWNEPWVWRPSDWPGQQLDLNVVENEATGIAVGFGNPGSVLFNYGGDTPGPTIRMRGDEILHVKLRNLLGQDFGRTPVGPFPDPATLTPGLVEEVCKRARQDPSCKAKAYLDQVYEVTGADVREDFCLGEHTNGVHANRVTNLHTHGLHVRPSRNPNGTHSDNVILRVLSQADYRRREQQQDAATCRFLEKRDEIYFLRDDEQAGEADYEFRLGDVQSERRAAINRDRVRQGEPPLPPQAHPAGTFWYHPHAHGATHNQVASGMAGFLIVEGDVDQAVNLHLAGQEVIDPAQKTGDWDYRERLMLIQRVLNLSMDPDASPKELRKESGNFQALTNGNALPTVIRMRPGAVERWRVLNGSVDGRGYKRFMVVKGQYTVTKADPDDPKENPSLFEIVPDPAKPGTGTLRPVTPDDWRALEQSKQPLWQLAIDGIPLIDTRGREPRYKIKDLSLQNPDAPNPLWEPGPDCPRQLRGKPAGEMICRLRNIWRTPESVRDTFVRPNEFYMAPANRTDLFFQAPPEPERGDAESGRFEVYTVLARAVLAHSDNPEQSAQRNFYNSVRGPDEPAQELPGRPPAEDVVVAWVVVSGDPVAKSAKIPAARLFQELSAKLPPVQEYLLPVGDDELRLTPGEARHRGVPAHSYRTRTVVYSGWGSEDFPLVSTFPSDPSAAAFQTFVETPEGRNLDRLRYAENCRVVDPASGALVDCNAQRVRNGEEPYYALLPANIRSMAIDAGGDPPDAGQPAGRKFDPMDPKRPRMLENTAEEWVLYNTSGTLWGNTTTEKRRSPSTPDAHSDPSRPDFEQLPTQYDDHFISYPITRAEGARIFDANPRFQIVSKGVDHPFHIHQNPFWVLRIEVPDETGRLVNILDEPRWMDVIWIPRNQGRVVFRSRFPDYVGAYVHHCHLLLHEDNGMMTVVEATPFADEANYEPSARVASPEMGADELSALYRRPTAEEAYVRSCEFVDPNEETGQVYPGFRVTPPKLP